MQHVAPLKTLDSVSLQFLRCYPVGEKFELNGKTYQVMGRHGASDSVMAMLPDNKQCIYIGPDVIKASKLLFSFE